MAIFKAYDVRGKYPAEVNEAFAHRLGRAFADFLGNAGTVGVGYDMRESSPALAAALSQGLHEGGVSTLQIDMCTSPTLYYAVGSHGLQGGVMVTASHNPPTDNGFKVRDQNGGAINPEGLKQIEALIPADMDSVKRKSLKEAEADGSITKFDSSTAYIEHLKDLIDLEPIKQAGLTVMVDAMWGNGAGWFPRLLEGGKTKVL